MSSTITYKKLDQLQRTIRQEIASNRQVTLRTTAGTTVALQPYLGEHTVQMTVQDATGNTITVRANSRDLAWFTDPAAPTQEAGPLGMLVHTKQIANDGQTMLFTDLRTGRHQLRKIDAAELGTSGPLHAEWLRAMREATRTPVVLDVPPGHTVYVRTLEGDVIPFVRDTFGVLRAHGVTAALTTVAITADNQLALTYADGRTTTPKATVVEISGAVAKSRGPGLVTVHPLQAHVEALTLPAPGDVFTNPAASFGRIPI